MYRCQVCQAVVPAGTSSKRLVVQTRKKKYMFRTHANSFVRTNENGKRKEYHSDDPGGEGHEIAREVIACPECAPASGK